LCIDIFNESRDVRPSSQGFHNAGGIRFTNDDVVIALVAIGIAVAATLSSASQLGIAIRATADSRETPAPRHQRRCVSSFAWAVGSIDLRHRRHPSSSPRLSGQLSFITLLALILPGFTGVDVRGSQPHRPFPRRARPRVVQNVVTSYHWPRGTLSDLFSAPARRPSSPSSS